MATDPPKVLRPVLVTGAARRIGRAIALGLADAGYAVAVHFNASSSEAHEVLDEIEAKGGRAVALRADLNEESEVLQLFEKTVGAFGAPFAIVNNASRFEFDTPSTFRFSQLDALMRSNVSAPLMLGRLMHQASQGLQRPEPGVIVNLLDQKLFNPNPDFFSYTLSKATLHTATTLMAQAFGPALRVVGIAPGLTLPSGDQSEDAFAHAHAKTPLARSSTPEDIVSAILFALANRALTGTTLLVDGGQHLVPSERDVMFLHR